MVLDQLRALPRVSQRQQLRIASIGEAHGQKMVRLSETKALIKHQDLQVVGAKAAGPWLAGEPTIQCD
jgi:hypothetical protein